jgi:hypothetical protein
MDSLAVTLENTVVGDRVVYTPTCPVGPVKERPWDVGTVVEVDDNYVTVQFPREYTAQILPIGLIHHPDSPKAIRMRMARVLPDIVGAVEARLGALVFSELTGITGMRGFGPADDVRAFLEPAGRMRPWHFVKDNKKLT